MRTFVLCALVILALVAALAQPAAPQPATPPAGLLVGPNVGWDTALQAPVDLAWDMPTRRLHARSLVLTETGDAVDLRIRRAPGTYPDGPLSGHQSPAGDVPGIIHWDALTPDGWREVAGIQGVLGDQSGPPPTAASHPGWLVFYTYSPHHDEGLHRVLINETGAVSMGGGGYGSEGLPAPAYGLHVFGGGMRMQAVPSPEAPRLSVVGQGGSRRYTYQVVAVDSQGHETPPGPAATILGPETLGEAGAIHLEWDRCAGAESYLVLRDGRRLEGAVYVEGNVKTYTDRGTPVADYTPEGRNATADAQVDGALTVGQVIYTPGVCRAEVTGGTMNDFRPRGLESAATLVLDPARPVRLTGLQAPAAEGRWLLVLNVGSAPVTLANASPASQPANRIVTGTGRDLVLGKDRLLQLVYVVGRWRVIGREGEAPSAITSHPLPGKRDG